jgi:hypothetical protein
MRFCSSGAPMVPEPECDGVRKASSWRKVQSNKTSPLHDVVRFNGMVVMKWKSYSRRGFISYRRSDSDALAGRLRDRLADALPDWTFFMDVASITPGKDFRQSIEAALSESTLCLVLIGPNWFAGLSRQPRGAQDFVADEIKIALDLRIQIIPVLCNDAKMPQPLDLPEAVRPMAYLAGVEVRHSRFEDDLRNLIGAIRSEHKSLVAPRSLRRTLRRIGGTSVGALVGVVLGLVCLVINFYATGKAASEWIGENAAALLLPALAIAGGVVGCLLADRRSDTISD